MSDNSKAKSSQKGQWSKGVSGNPTGRPRGSRNRSTLAMEALLEDGAEQLINKAMKMALAGDTAALRICLERIFCCTSRLQYGKHIPDIEFLQVAAVNVDGFVRIQFAPDTFFQVT